MSAIETKIFNNPDHVSRGWYWLMPSRDLKVGAKCAVTAFGDELVLYRGASGRVSALSAYCVHMGAHLKDGRVVGDTLQCGYHGWQYASDGSCVAAPCLRAQVDLRKVPRAKTYHVREKFSMIWIFSDFECDADEVEPLPSFDGLEDLMSVVDQPEIRNCHHTFILGSGIDEDHFNFVHQKTTDMSGPVEFSVERISKSVIRFRNIAEIPKRTLKNRILHWLYRGTLTYEVTYWFGSTALARLGFPWLPMYSIFAYRPTGDGRSHAVNIYLTPHRSSILGRLISNVSLAMTKSILRGGGDEDRVFQNAIRLRLSKHSLTNPPFAQFVEYLEEQPAVNRDQRRNLKG